MDSHKFSLIFLSWWFPCLDSRDLLERLCFTVPIWVVWNIKINLFRGTECSLLAKKSTRFVNSFFNSKWVKMTIFQIRLIKVLLWIRNLRIRSSTSSTESKTVLWSKLLNSNLTFYWSISLSLSPKKSTVVAILYSRVWILQYKPRAFIKVPL